MSTHFKDETKKKSLNAIRHDIRNALVCVRRVSEMIPVLGQVNKSDLEQVQLELIKASHILESAFLRNVCPKCGSNEPIINVEQ